MRKVKSVIFLLLALAVTTSSTEDVQKQEIELDRISDCSVEKQNTLRKLLNQNSIFIVSTLDGKIIALDDNDNGRILWILKTNEEGLLNSTIGNFQFVSDKMYFKLVPALNGSLYKLNEQKQIIEPVPLDADVLLKSSYKLGDELMINGGKEVKTFAINLITGELKYSCGSEDCGRFQKGPDNNSASNTLLIRQHIQRVRAINPHNGEEVWRFDVGENDAYLLATNDDCHLFDQLNLNEKDSEQNLVLELDEGMIGMVSKKGLESWSFKFESPIAAVWQYKGGKLNSIDVFNKKSQNTAQISKPNMPYIGIHKGQFYIMGSDQSRDFNVKKFSQPNRLKIEGPEEASTNSYELQMLNEPSNICIKKPVNRNQVIQKSADNVFNLTIEDPYNDTDESSTMGTIEKVIIFSYSQVIFVSIMIAIFINIVFSYLWKVFKRQETNCSTPLLSDYCDSVVEAQEELPQKPQLVLSEPISRSRSSDSESSAPFMSRYYTDFQPISCLGKGGFGVVFEARNKIDDCRYAIKRINLPLQQAAREKVMREVRALASLDHQGIVRYYNSWMEAPPEGWQSEGQIALENSLINTDLRSNPSSESDFGVYFNSPDKNSSLYDLPKQALSENDSYVVFERSSSSANNNDSQETGFHQTNSKNHLKVENKSADSSFGPGTYLYIQMQLCQKNTLREWLKTNKERDKAVIYDYFVQIVDAVDYVHSKKLMHRDLKPSNIFFAMDGCIKIGDFGLVTDFAVDFFNYNSPHDTISWKKKVKSKSKHDKTHTNQVGTRLYMSPELISGAKYSNKVDIYSLGVIFFEMLVSFETEMERVTVLTQIRDGGFPSSFNSKYSKERELVVKLLCRDPDERPLAGEILADKIFVDFEEENMLEIMPRKRSHSKSKAY